jgi:N-acetylneuraminic acid mutarotase
MLVIGGKTGPSALENMFTSTVFGFDIDQVLNSQPAIQGWQSLAHMTCARALFACTVVDNNVYVFGGIQGAAQHQPIMAIHQCERYDPIADKWESIAIQGALSIAGFGWSILNAPH